MTHHDYWHIHSHPQNVTVTRNESQFTIMKRGKLKVIAWVVAVVFAFTAVAGWLALRWIRNGPPKEAMRDIKAAIAARHAPKQVERYLEERYGSMTNAANREAAFLDFFNVDHIKALDFLVKHMPPERRQSNIDAMADWVSQYRTTMTDQEKEDLRTQLTSPEGVSKIRQATSQYLQQDVHYRAANAVVIAELMTTLTTLQNQ